MAKGQIKPKMTEDNVQKLIIALQSGKHRSSACVVAGIARTTFYEWLDADENFRTRVEDAEEFWLALVEWKLKEKVEEWYRPAIEKELKSKRREVYGDKLDTTEKIVQTTIDYKELKDKTPAELDELRRTLLG